MSLLFESIEKKKFDSRMLEKNIERGVIQEKEAKQFIDQLPDDAENAEYVDIETLE